MATISQIQTGFARFIDTHISGAFSGWQKAVVVGGATLLAANLPNLVKVYGATLWLQRWAYIARRQEPWTSTNCTMRSFPTLVQTRSRFPFPKSEQSN